MNAISTFHAYLWAVIQLTISMRILHARYPLITMRIDKVKWITAHNNCGKPQWHSCSLVYAEKVNFGPRHCFSKRALENKLLNQNWWSWYFLFKQKLRHTLKPIIASTYCGKYAVPFFSWATLYSITTHCWTYFLLLTSNYCNWRVFADWLSAGFSGVAKNARKSTNNCDSQQSAYPGTESWGHLLAGLWKQHDLLLGKKKSLLARNNEIFRALAIGRARLNKIISWILISYFIPGWK